MKKHSNTVSAPNVDPMILANMLTVTMNKKQTLDVAKQRAQQMANLEYVAVKLLDTNGKFICTFLKNSICLYTKSNSEKEFVVWRIAFQAKDRNSWWNGLPVTSRLRQMTSLMAQINCIGGKAHAGMNGSQAQRQDHAEKSAQYAQTQGLFLGSTISKQWSPSCRRNGRRKTVL